MATKKRSSTKGLFELSDVYKAPGHLIRRCQQIAVAIFLDEFRGLEITPVQFAALVAIRDRPGIDQKTLVNLVASDRSTIGFIMRTLEERLLISRITPKHNQRIKQLYILPAGAKLLDMTRSHIERVNHRILAPLEPKERDQFMSYLARLVDLNNSLSRAPLVRDVASSDVLVSRETIGS